MQRSNRRGYIMIEDKNLTVSYELLYLLQWLLENEPAKLKKIITHALHKMNVYSSCSAAMRKQQRGTPSLLKVVLSACWMFFRCYILQGGFLEGKDGFLLAVLSAEGSFYRGIKMIYHDKEGLI